MALGPLGDIRSSLGTPPGGSRSPWGHQGWLLVPSRVLLVTPGGLLAPSEHTGVALGPLGDIPLSPIPPPQTPQLTLSSHWCALTATCVPKGLVSTRTSPGTALSGLGAGTTPQKGVQHVPLPAPGHA